VSDIQQLAKLARFMGFDEVAIMAGQVFYIDTWPDQSLPVAYDPRTNAEQSQELQERLKINVCSTPGDNGGWVASIEASDMFSQNSGETVREAILNVALQYIKRYKL
jgi:hypothetical protein